MRLFPVDQPRQSYRLKRTLLGLAFYLLCELIIGFCVWQGLVPLFPFAVHGFAVLTVNAAFFTIIRLGWNLRLKDPSLTEPQIVASVLLCCYIVIYAGQLRGVFMLANVIGLMFGLMFGTTLPVRQLARLALLPALLFPITAYIAARQSPATFDWRIEVVSWFSVYTILACTVMMVGRLSLLQKRLKASNADLKSAMAKLTNMAMHDELTGVYNRRYVLDMLERAKSMADRCGDDQFCVCMLDIDHFKRVNDTYGHGNGDIVLRTFAMLVGGVLRRADFLARWGGEEFLVLMPQCSVGQAAVCMERIKAALENTSFEGLPPDFRVTMSAGVAQYRAHGSIQDLIERADRALYGAKNGGRNCIVEAADACGITD